MNSESDLTRELTNTLNAYSAENDSETPDFILAQYLIGCLKVFNDATVAREKWYRRPVKRDTIAINMGSGPWGYTVQIPAPIRGTGEPYGDGIGQDQR